jgi:hypothetical protein
LVGVGFFYEVDNELKVNSAGRIRNEIYVGFLEGNLFYGKAFFSPVHTGKGQTKLWCEDQGVALKVFNIHISGLDPVKKGDGDILDAYPGIQRSGQLGNDFFRQRGLYVPVLKKQQSQCRHGNARETNNERYVE